MFISNLKSAHGFAIILAVSLTLMYGLVPANPELFGVMPRSADMIAENLQGALVLAAIIAFVGYRLKGNSSTRDPTPIPAVAVVTIFMAGCLWLNANNWINVREGVEGTISALFRIAWLVIIINLKHQNMNILERMAYILATAILMLFDQSRTYFLIALLIIVVDIGWVAVGSAIVLALLVAAIRSGENDGLYHSIMFAVGGEGYLGSQGVFQVLSLDSYVLNFHIPAIQSLFSPITSTVALVAKRMDMSADIFDSSSYIGSYIKDLTGETYPPMGGFFIISEFIRAGVFGFLCMTIYIFMSFLITKKLFDTVEFPVGSFIAILTIKNSPMTYWNLVISVMIVSYVLRQVTMTLRAGPSGRSALASQSRYPS